MSNTKLFIAFMIAALAAAGLYFGLNAAGPKPQGTSAPRPIPVSTTSAVQENMPVRIRSIGTVISPHSVEVRSQIDGELTELLVADGQNVKQGDLLARIDDRSINAVLRQQRAELANRQAQLDVAALDLNRYERLHTQNAISAQVLDQQKALVAQLRQSIATQRAVINEQEVRLSYTRILSPISGVMGIINVHQGNYVRAGDAQSLFSIVQLDPISVEISLPQSLLPQVLPVSTASLLTSIPVFAYSNDEQQLLAQGHLSRIDNQVSANTGTIRARAEFSNVNQTLWPGQTVIAVLEMRQIEDAITVPQTAIRYGNGYTYVWRVEDDRAHEVTVQVIHTESGQVAVTGIQAGNEVVTDGASRLAEGSLIRRIHPLQETQPEQTERTEEVSQ